MDSHLIQDKMLTRNWHRTLHNQLQALVQIVATCPAFSSLAHVSTLDACSVQGVVLSCNRKAKNPSDRVGTSYTGHHGPVYGLRR